MAPQMRRAAMSIPSRRRETQQRQDKSPIIRNHPNREEVLPRPLTEKPGVPRKKNGASGFAVYECRPDQANVLGNKAASHLRRLGTPACGA